jgi:hypothetical protein
MLMTSSFTRTVRFKVHPETYGWLSAAAVEVNQVFNFRNESSLLAATRTDLKRKWLTGFDLSIDNAKGVVKGRSPINVKELTSLPYLAAPSHSSSAV